MKSQLNKSVETYLKTTFEISLFPRSMNFHSDENDEYSATMHCSFCTTMFVLRKQGSASWQTTNYYRNTRSCNSKSTNAGSRNIMSSFVNKLDPQTFEANKKLSKNLVNLSEEVIIIDNSIKLIPNL